MINEKNALDIITFANIGIAEAYFEDIGKL